MSLVLSVSSEAMGLYLFRCLGSVQRKPPTPPLCFDASYSAIMIQLLASPEAPLQGTQGTQPPN